MSEPAHPVRRKNPLPWTKGPTVPPSARSRAALGLTAAAALGRFELQVCRDCQAVQYPPREACHRCLSLRLDWRQQSGSGELISDTLLLHSNEPYFRDRLPWRVGLVRLDAGPNVVVHVHGEVPAAPARVRVDARIDKAGQAALIALPQQDSPSMADDKLLHEMTCDPKSRKVLVTDGKTAVGQTLVRALVAAGADLVWVGDAKPWSKCPEFEALRELGRVAFLPLDVSNSAAIKEAAAQIALEVDILINNAEAHRPSGIGARSDLEAARAEMDINYFGLLGLAEEFGRVMCARGADGQSNGTAWVNVLSIFALANYPAHGTFSASKAAAYSLAQCLRAEMRQGGVRMINVFPGPLDDQWNQALTLPKVTPRALAAAIVKALQDGVEDVYPGEAAQELHARWRESPKVLERELALGG